MLSNKIITNKINKINNMTFQELRNELAECNNNPIKELLIRNIMKQKAIKYIVIKKKQKLKQRKTKILNNNNDNEEYELVDDMLDDDIISQDIYLSENDIKSLPDHGPLNELEENESIKEKQQARDLLNNNLMNRMNAELNIRKSKKNKTKKEVISPFADDVGMNYAPYNYQDNIVDFSNK